jgi:hypothetical protein
MQRSVNWENWQFGKVDEGVLRGSLMSWKSRSSLNLKFHHDVTAEAYKHVKVKMSLNHSGAQG